MLKKDIKMKEIKNTFFITMMKENLLITIYPDIMFFSRLEMSNLVKIHA